MSAAPVVLVHGAWAQGRSWVQVQAELEKRGVASRVVDLPSAGPAPATMADDAAAVRRTLARLWAPGVLVGHCYSGAPVTEAAAGNDRVAHLVYVCAVMPEEGQSTGALMGDDPVPSRIGEAVRRGGDGTTTLDPLGAREFLFNDLSPAQATAALAGLGTHRTSVFAEAPTAAGWREHPSTYVVTTEDRVFSPDLQHRMAERAGTVVALQAGHHPMLGRAGQLADVIAEVAHAAGGRPEVSRTR